MSLGPRTKRFLRELVKDELGEAQQNTYDHHRHALALDLRHRTCANPEACRFDLEAKRERRFLSQAKDRVKFLTAALKELRK